MTKSKVIIGVGLFLILIGLTTLFLPAPNEAGIRQLDTEGGLMSGWLILSGIGLIAHKKSAYHFYLIGGVIFALWGAVGSFSNYGDISSVLLMLIIFIVPFGIPALFVWARQEYLQPWFSEDSSDA